MRIPLNHLMSALSIPSQQIFSGSGGPLSSVCRPRFYFPGDSVVSGQLYVASPDAPLPEKNPAVFLTDPAPAQLLNRVQAVFDQCEAQEDALTEAAATGDLRELLDEMESVLGNPVILFRSNYAIVGCSSEVFSNPDLSSLRGTHLPYDYVVSLKLRPAGGKGPFCTLPVTKTPGLLLSILQDQDVEYYLLSIPLLRPLQEADRFPMDQCAAAAVKLLKNAVIFARYADPSGRGERLVELFRTAVEMETADLTVLEQGFSALGWLPSHQYACLSLRLGTPEHLSHTLELICSQLEALLPEACLYVLPDSIAVLANLTRTGCSVRALIERCVYFFRDNDLRVGVSNPFSGFQSLRSYRRQSCIALDFASRPQSYLWTQYFSDVVLDYILEQSNRELPLRLVCSPQILQIRQYDQDHQTEFYTTLEAYIQNKFNAVQTAKELQIHRSTFLYRMERLQTLFGLDLNRRDSLLYILLSMKMLELSKSMILHE